MRCPSNHSSCTSIWPCVDRYYLRIWCYILGNAVDLVVRYVLQDHSNIEVLFGSFHDSIENPSTKIFRRFHRQQYTFQVVVDMWDSKYILWSLWNLLHPSICWHYLRSVHSSLRRGFLLPCPWRDLKEWWVRTLSILFLTEWCTYIVEGFIVLLSFLFRPIVEKLQEDTRLAQSEEDSQP